MKYGILVMALTIGLLASVMTGSAPAGDRVAAIQDPEAVPNPTWMAEGPVETGALPEVSGSASMDGGMASGDAAFPLVEAGGVLYRAGIDTGA